MRVQYDIHESFFKNSEPSEEARFEKEIEIILKYIYNRSAVIQKEFESKIALKINLNFPKFLNALVDSFADIRRIVDFHELGNGPDQVKLASHVAFWFIRWQPCSIESQEDFLLSTALTKKEKKEIVTRQ